MTIDDAGRGVDTVVVTDVRVVDTTSPTVYFGASGEEAAVGSDIVIDVAASDNHKIASIHWEFGSPVLVRDSAVSAHGAPLGSGIEARIRVKPEWLGLRAGFRAWARDVIGNVSQIRATSDTAWSFYREVATGSWLALAALEDVSGSRVVHDVVYDAKRDRLYASITGNSRVVGIDVGTMQRAGVVTTSALPGGMDFSPDSNLLYVTHSLQSGLGVIALNTFVADSPIPIPVLDSIGVDANRGTMPMAVRTAANGRAFIQLYFAQQGTRTIELHIPTGETRLRRDADGAGGVRDHWWRFSESMRDRSQIVFHDPLCRRTYVAATDEFAACAGPGVDDSAIGMSFSPSNGRYLVGTRVFDAEHQVVATIPTAIAALAEDGQTAIYALGGHVYRVRLSDGKVIARMPLPFEVDQVFLLPGGQRLIGVASSQARFLRLDISGFLAFIWSGGTHRAQVGLAR